VISGFTTNPVRLSVAGCASSPELGWRFKSINAAIRDKQRKEVEK
jgi:hypothetical protein